MIQSKIYEYFSKNSKEILITENDKEAQISDQVLKFIGFETFVLPDFRALHGEDLRSYYDELVLISTVLSAFYKCKNKKIIISPIRTILNKLPAKSQLKFLNLKFADKLEISNFKDEILRIGYLTNDIVQSKGEVSFRGEIIDIFALNYEKPIRILLNDDEIESIRFFDESTQKSEPTEIESIEIAPFLANLSKDEFENTNEKIANFDSDALIKDLSSLGFWFIDGFIDYLQNFSFICLNKLDTNEIFSERNLDFLNHAEILPEPKKFKDLVITPSAEFFEFHKDAQITLISRNSALIDELNISISPNIKILREDLVVNLISNDEIIISLNKFKAKKRVRKSSLAVDELQIGDFVVHENYGVAKFAGLELIEVLGSKSEFVVLEYFGGDKLLLPVQNLNLIDRYIASGVATLDKLGKAGFAKIKEKVREKLFAIASKIIQTAAARELVRGIVIENNTPEYAKFLSSAGFEYTKDQQNAVNAIFTDLKSGKVMDRLISGDVGFGKTEVAMNAIFACIKSGYSALFFVPTTLLSAQHYATLKERLTPFKIQVFRLDRFTGAKEKAEISKKIKDKIPIVIIGTHALLNMEVANLGLIIIDEEHKFGVKQKEKLKSKSAASHVLSMSATPIPRSLNMALSSLKSYSVLSTPPLDRLDVRTFVKERDEKIIKEAIMREIRRGGQVFFVHNHIATIETCRKNLQKIVPNLKILILHSQIDAKTTENEILKFEAGEYEILLCTSIVESGIHMPNVNTIIVENANKFGIADLHQLRGRVGRSAKQGFCYFMVEDKTALNEDAIKRLIALESNSFLGSGSVLAYHDLEIRGGGNLIGEAQSGHIEAIGYSLYLKMLEDEINKLMNKKTQNKDVELKIAVNAFLNSDFIREDRLRLDLYRRLSKAETVSQVYEIFGEIEDRFGKADIYTKQFIDLMIIKILANSLNIRSITSAEQNILITYANGEKMRLKSSSKDDDDVLAEILIYLRKENKKHGLE